jgi:hypothetical protein
MTAKGKRRLLTIGLVILGIVLIGIWYMSTRIYIESTAGRSFRDGKDMADVTAFVQAGAQVITRDGTAEAIRLKTPPPLPTPEAFALMKKAMIRMGQKVLPKDDWPALEAFEPRSSLKYLETYAFDSDWLIHVYQMQFMVPSSGQPLILYPNVTANDEHPEKKTGDLHDVWVCNQNYAVCPDYLKKHIYYPLIEKKEN